MKFILESVLDSHFYDQKSKCQNRKSKMLKSKILKIQGSSVRRVLSTPPSLCVSEGGAQVWDQVLIEMWVKRWRHISTRRPFFSFFRQKIKRKEKEKKSIKNGAKHSPLSFASKILGDPKGCSRASNIWCIFVSSMLNLKIILQTIFDNFQIHLSYDNVL